MVPDIVALPDSGAENQMSFVPPAVLVMMWPAVAEGQY
jgi:hypothetical protein